MNQETGSIKRSASLAILKRVAGILLFLFLLAFAPPAKAQFHSAAISSQIVTLQGVPVPYAKVRICPYTGSGVPCTPLASLYSDPGLTQSVPNPYSADQNGFFSVFVSNSIPFYSVQESPNLSTTYIYYANAPSTGSGGGCTTGSVAGWAQFSNGSGGCLSQYIDYGVTYNNTLTINTAPTGGSILLDPDTALGTTGDGQVAIYGKDEDAAVDIEGNGNVNLVAGSIEVCGWPISGVNCASASNPAEFDVYGELNIENGPTTSELFVDDGAGIATGGFLQTFPNELSSSGSPYSLSYDTYFQGVDAASGNVVINLPQIVSGFLGNTGETYLIEKEDSTSNTVTINAYSSQTIAGSASQTLTAEYQNIEIVAIAPSSGSPYWVIKNSSGGGGSAPTLQTNSVNNASQNLLNLETSTTNAVGLTVTPVNPSGGIEKFEITGSNYTGNAATATDVTVSQITSGSVGNFQLVATNGTLGTAVGLSAGQASTADFYLTPSTGYLNVPTGIDVAGSPFATGNLADWTNSGIVNGYCPIWNSGTNKWTPGACVGSGFAFNNIASGTNTTASMTVGSGGSFGYTGTGTVNANIFASVPLCSGWSPSNSQFLQYTTGGSPNPCWTSAAASGSGNTTSTSLTSTYLPEANGANSIINSPFFDANPSSTPTRESGMTGLDLSSDATYSSWESWTGNTTNFSVVGSAHRFYLFGPASTSFTSYAWQLPTAGNSSAGILHVGAPSSSVSALSISAVALTDLATQGADTFVANMTASTAQPTAVAVPTTAHGVWLGEGTATPPSITAAGAANTALLGQGSSADPLFGTVTHSYVDSSVVTDSGNTTTTAQQVAVSTGTAGAVKFIDYPAPYAVAAANCVSGSGGSAWNTTLVAACRGGTYNLDGNLPFSDTSTGQFTLELPADWDTATNPYVRLLFTTGANTSGTIIFNVAISCYADNNSATDDQAFQTAQTFSTITAAHANYGNAVSLQLNNTSMTGCTAGGGMIVKITRATDTASSAIPVTRAVVTIPRLIAVQAE